MTSHRRISFLLTQTLLLCGLAAGASAQERRPQSQTFDIHQYYIQKDGAVIVRDLQPDPLKNGYGDWRYATADGKRVTAKLGRRKSTGEAYWVFAKAKNNPRRAADYDIGAKITPDKRDDMVRPDVDGPGTGDDNASTGPSENGSGRLPSSDNGGPLSLEDLGGVYESNYGSVRIIQDGPTVHGVVTYANGSQGQWEGNLSGDVIDFEWRNETDHGTGQLRVLPARGLLDGYFVDQNGKQGSWYMKRGGAMPVKANSLGSTTAGPVLSQTAGQRSPQTFVPVTRGRACRSCRRSR